MELYFSCLQGKNVDTRNQKLFYLIYADPANPKIPKIPKSQKVQMLFFAPWTTKIKFLALKRLDWCIFLLNSGHLLRRYDKKIYTCFFLNFSHVTSGLKRTVIKNHKKTLSLIAPALAGIHPKDSLINPKFIPLQ